jgi:hypothetical protein
MDPLIAATRSQRIHDPRRAEPARHLDHSPRTGRRGRRRPTTQTSALTPAPNPRSPPTAPGPTARPRLVGCPIVQATSEGKGLAPDSQEAESTFL